MVFEVTISKSVSVPFSCSKAKGNLIERFFLLKFISVSVIFLTILVSIATTYWGGVPHMSIRFWCSKPVAVL